MIVDARQKLTKLEGWIRETYPTGHDWFTVEGDVQLYYRLNDLYILGFRVGDCSYTCFEAARQGVKFVSPGNVEDQPALRARSTR